MSSNGAELPQEVLIDILSRLPAKSLCRFKCVSKPWLTLISDPHFTQIHLNRNKPQRFILFSDYLYSVDCDEASDSAFVMATKLDFPPIDYPNELIDILGSCNGLILIANEENTKFLLNPTTRESKKLPKSPFALDSFSSHTMYGLGYDSSTDDYKVLSVAYNARYEDDDDEEEECTDTFVSVFSLKTGAWRRIQDVPYDHSSLEPYSLVLVNGSIHWLTCRSSDSSSVIAAFDVAEEKFRDVPAPSSIDNNQLVLHGLGVFGGFLCVLVCCNSIETDVWTMKEYGVTESWTKFTTICMPNMHVMEPLCFLVDEEVLLEMDGKKLVAFNAKERTSRDIVVRGIPRTFRAGKTYVESLVSPCCNSGIERKYKGSRNLKNCQLNRMASQIANVEESALWSTHLERCFVDIMVDEVNKGNMPSRIFTSKCWKKIEEEFQKKTNHAYNIKQLKQKFNRLRTKYREFSTLLSETTGFGWDAETSTLTADEETWKTYLRAHPNAKCFRKKGCENYKLLGVLFNMPIVPWQLHYASTQDPTNIDEEREQEDTGIHVSSIIEGQDDSDYILLEDNNPRRRKSISSNRCAKKETKKDSISDTLACIAEVSRSRTEASLAKAERYKKMKHNQEVTSLSRDVYSLSNCIKCLEGLDEIDDDTYLKATEKFKELHYRELFIKMSISRKFAWLRSLD